MYLAFVSASTSPNFMCLSRKVRTLKQFQLTPQAAESILWDADARFSLKATSPGSAPTDTKLTMLERCARARRANDWWNHTCLSLSSPSSIGGGLVRRTSSFAVAACVGPLEAMLASESYSNCKTYQPNAILNTTTLNSTAYIEVLCS